jgi:hypothetical protein
MTPWIPLPPDEVTLAFPANVVGVMPGYVDLRTTEFDRLEHPLRQFAERWFSDGLAPRTMFLPTSGINTKLALRHLHGILRSTQPKHEHKLAAVAFLLNEWFVEIVEPEAQRRWRRDG